MAEKQKFRKTPFNYAQKKNQLIRSKVSILIVMHLALNRLVHCLMPLIWGITTSKLRNVAEVFFCREQGENMIENQYKALNIYLHEYRFTLMKGQSLKPFYGG